MNRYSYLLCLSLVFLLLTTVGCKRWKDELHLTEEFENNGDWVFDTNIPDSNTGTPEATSELSGGNLMLSVQQDGVCPTAMASLNLPEGEGDGKIKFIDLNMSDIPFLYNLMTWFCKTELPWLGERALELEIGKAT